MFFTASKTELIDAEDVQRRSDALILNQINMKKTFSCSFCSGYGHTVKECPTIKKVDKMAQKGSSA